MQYTCEFLRAIVRDEELQAQNSLKSGQFLPCDVILHMLLLLQMSGTGQYSLIFVMTHSDVWVQVIWTTTESRPQKTPV